jgi:hypothetical protein
MADLPIFEETVPKDEGQGETDLPTLLTAIAPRLHEQTFVFCTTEAGKSDRRLLTKEAIMRFRESEGHTLIVPQTVAEAHDLPYQGTWRMITLTVHSSLEAVGFLASVLPALAAAGISTNVVSAYHHDHLFVPAPRAQDALSILQSIK